MARHGIGNGERRYLLFKSHQEECQTGRQQDKERPKTVNTAADKSVLDCGVRQTEMSIDES